MNAERLEFFLADFWFKPYLYIHPSWLCDIEQRLINLASPSIAWHYSYSYLCKKYKLNQRLTTIPDRTTEEIILDIALHKVEYDSHKSPCLKIVSEMSDISTLKMSESPLKVKRKIMQVSKALSLQRKFQSVLENSEQWEIVLLCLYLSNTYPEYWQRLRLYFDRDMILNIEGSLIDNKISDVKIRILRRLWSEAILIRDYERSLMEIQHSQPEVA